SGFPHSGLKSLPHNGNSCGVSSDTLIDLYNSLPAPLLREQKPKRIGLLLLQKNLVMVIQICGKLINDLPTHILGQWRSVWGSAHDSSLPEVCRGVKCSWEVPQQEHLIADVQRDSPAILRQSDKAYNEGNPKENSCGKDHLESPSV